MKNDPFKVFNVNEFKKWMEKSSGDLEREESLVGSSVSSKIGFKKLKEVSEVLDCERALVEFHKNGGTVAEEENDVLTVRTDKGSIRLSKAYISIN